jgi:hypothetical protein
MLLRVASSLRVNQPSEKITTGEKERERGKHVRANRRLNTRKSTGEPHKHSHNTRFVTLYLIALRPEDTACYMAEGKMVPGKPIAFCNTFWRPERDKVPPRRRGLLEPLINDAIEALKLAVHTESDDTQLCRAIHTCSGSGYEVLVRPTRL